ncbi:hypothetical protein [Nocardioides albus]|uniref:Uncharacterized protein n=1 Tax=Nocardioides albus TaxID=1841 RepID=A0A7W5F9C2_9ACTN|nr:hypothetical protein [Nocardioides albus]MBB3090085.1 hypothetical protein [Nocardioides albus]GGU27605.1 hypothetical protein GCM10007979_27930 [Nocardioides albus]
MSAVDSPAELPDVHRFGPADGPPAGTGMDVAVIERGQVSKIYGFFS